MSTTHDTSAASSGRGPIAGRIAGAAVAAAVLFVAPFAALTVTPAAVAAPGDPFDFHGLEGIGDLPPYQEKEKPSFDFHGLEGIGDLPPYQETPAPTDSFDFKCCSFDIGF